MKLLLNGAEQDVQNVHTIEQLLQALGIPTERGGIAVARNGAVVSRSDWARTPVEEGDWLELITAVQGG